MNIRNILLSLVSGVTIFHVYGEITVDFISFEDMRPDDVPCFGMGYGTIGIDPDDNIYAAWCGDANLCRTDRNTTFGDCALFQYNPETGERRLLGSLRETAQSVDNLGPNEYWNKTEIFMKGHTHLPYLNGKIYMGTQEFHSMAGMPTNLYDYRGGHIFAYDIANDRLEDVSVDQPKGVFIENQGIIQLWEYAPENLIMGWTIPRGDIIMYNTLTGESEIKPGIDAEVEQVNEPVREFIPTPQGRIYYMYQNGPVYEYDMESGIDRATSYTMENGGCEWDMWGFWNGLAMPDDGKKSYVSTYGYLYELDNETGEFTFLTEMLPLDEDRYICRVWGLALSLDQKKLYWIPTNGTAAWRLYEYDIESNTVVFLKDLSSLIDKNQTLRPPAALSEVSGDNITDSRGRIYFVRHTYDNSGGSGIIQIDVSERSGPAPETGIGRRSRVPPAANDVSVSFRAGRLTVSFTSAAEGVTVGHRLLDAGGRVVFESGNGRYRKGRNVETLSLGRLNDGVYTYQLILGTDRISKNIISIGSGR